MVELDTLESVLPWQANLYAIHAPEITSKCLELKDKKQIGAIDQWRKWARAHTIYQVEKTSKKRKHETLRIITDLLEPRTSADAQKWGLWTVADLNAGFECMEFTTRVTQATYDRTDSLHMVLDENTVWMPSKHCKLEKNLQWLEIDMAERDCQFDEPPKLLWHTANAEIAMRVVETGMMQAQKDIPGGVTGRKLDSSTQETEQDDDQKECEVVVEFEPFAKVHQAQDSIERTEVPKTSGLRVTKNENEYTFHEEAVQVKKLTLKRTVWNDLMCQRLQMQELKIRSTL